MRTTSDMSVDGRPMDSEVVHRVSVALPVRFVWVRLRGWFFNLEYDVQDAFGTGVPAAYYGTLSSGFGLRRKL
jgi:hypothetical protein